MTKEQAERPVDLGGPTQDLVAYLAWVVDSGDWFPPTDDNHYSDEREPLSLVEIALRVRYRLGPRDRRWAGAELLQHIHVVDAVEQGCPSDFQNRMPWRPTAFSADPLAERPQETRGSRAEQSAGDRPATGVTWLTPERAAPR